MGLGYSQKHALRQKQLSFVPSHSENSVETGDIILVRELDNMDFAATHPGITRGMIGHMKGHFDTELKIELSGWTGVGVIYRLPIDREERAMSKGGRERLRQKHAKERNAYVIIADRLGVQLWTYAAFLRHSVEEHHVVVCRHLQCTAPVSYTGLDDFYKCLVPVGVSWLSCRGGNYPHPYIKTALRNAAVRSKPMPKSIREELSRYFLNLDIHGLGYVDARAIKELLVRIHGKDVSDAQVKLLMNAVDIDHDGHITLEELIAGFEKKPFTEVAPEHDSRGMVAGELVALIYEDLGLLVRRHGLEKTYDAGSFARAGHIVLLKHAHLSTGVSLKFKHDEEDDSDEEDELDQLNDDEDGLDHQAGERLLLAT